MSAPADAPASVTSELADTGDTDAAGGTRRPRVRRGWVLAGVVVACLVAVGVLFAAFGPSATSSVPLDPANPGPNGSQALARVLEQHGVSVTVARSQSELERAGVGSDTTVFVARTDDLDADTSLLLRAVTQSAARMVVVTPRRVVVRALDPSVGVVAEPRTAPVSGPCVSQDVRAGEGLSRSQVAFTAPTSEAACFTEDDSSVYLQTRTIGGGPPLVLFGSSSALTNQEVTEADNAAVVLRMLGHSPRLVWYVPSRSDQAPDDDSAVSFVPGWLGPATLLTGVVVLAVMLWRGRRLGPLVREPLPVTVRAIETTESRGRMYRRARDAVLAGSVLQDATRHRLAATLGLPPGAPPAALVDAVAAATGRPAAQVGSLLAGPPPTDDAGLLSFANALTALEEEVHGR